MPAPSAQRTLVQNLPFLMHLDDPAKCALQNFREQCRDWENEADGLMKSHIGKLPGLAVRVSLVLALLDWAIEGSGEPVTSISAAHLGRACHYVGEHLRGHAYCAYGAASVPQEVRDARRIAEIIVEGNLSNVSPRKIQRRNLSGLQSSGRIKAAFAVLSDADWVRRLTPSTGGRPGNMFAVNPKIGGTK